MDLTKGEKRRPVPGLGQTRAVSVRPVLSWPERLPAHGAVLLRPFRDGDLPLIAELATDPHIPAITTVPSRYTDSDGRAYLARQYRRLTEGTGWSFAIAALADDRALGQIGLWLPHPATGRAMAGYVVAPSARGRGVATAALLALTDFAWTLPELYRVELYIEPWNAGSIAVATRAGFTREGLLRSHQEIAGTRRDMLLFAAVRGSGFGGGDPAGVRSV